jgi:hypothetical protein
MTTWILPLLLATTGTPPAAIPPPRVTEVTIDAGWGGLGQPGREHYAIHRGEDAYVLTGDVAKEASIFGGAAGRRMLTPATVDAAAVQALAQALRAPDVLRETAFARLADPDWFARIAPLQLARRLQAPACSPQARELFVHDFTDPARMRKALADYYEGFWFDDYPRVAVSVTLDDGTRLAAESTSQKQYMLPWTRDGRPTWSLDLAAAIAAVLPPDAPSRSRLAEGNLADDLSYHLVPPRDSAWEDLEGRCVHRAALEVISRQFEVVHVHTTQADTLGVTLRRDDFPPNLTIYAVLSGEPADGPRELARFLEKIPAYLELAMPYARAHPGQAFELFHYHASSLDDEDIALNESGRNARRLRRVRDDAVVLRDPDPRVRRSWVLLPDGSVRTWN